MGLFGRKQEKARSNFSWLGRKSQERTSKSKEPSPSGFGGKPYVRREQFRNWLRKDEVWSASKMSKNERVGLEKQLFDPKKTGSFIKEKDAQKVYKEIKNFPKKSAEKYGLKSQAERTKTLKVLEKFLGK